MKTQNFENFTLEDFENVPNLPANLNVQPRQQVVLIEDLSGSTSPFWPEIMKAGDILFDTIQNDPDAVNRIELMIIGFGDRFKVLREFDTIENDKFPKIEDGLGGTVFCPPIEFAIEQAVQKRKEFREQGIVTGKPIIIFISDGRAHDDAKLSL